MARDLAFEANKIYHILNRGVDKRIIFQDNADYYRFIFILYVCNIGSPALNLWRRDIIKSAKMILAGEKPLSEFIQDECDQLVDILAVCLMPNHFHVIMIQKRNEGISLFMRKIGIAFTKYFNFRNQRVGRLFQGPFKAILVDDEDYLLRLSRYVHLNPLDLSQSGDWRKDGVKNWKEAINFLKNYTWSSLPDYLGIRDSKLITTKGLYNIFFDNFSKKGKIDYGKFLTGWSDEEFDEIKYLILE